MDCFRRRIGKKIVEEENVVSVALALLMGTQAGKEKHEMNIQKLLVCSEMWRGSPFSKTALASATSPTLPSHPLTLGSSSPTPPPSDLRLTSSRPPRYRFCDTSWRKHRRGCARPLARYQSKKGLKLRWKGEGGWNRERWEGQETRNIDAERRAPSTGSALCIS